MKRLITAVAGGLVLVLLCAGQVPANDNVRVQDVYRTDLNTIVDQSYEGNQVEVSEDYNETCLIPYPSHDGWAIVNPARNYFDKRVIFVKGLVEPPVSWTFVFAVHNTTPYCWSDYHFELWDEDFTSRREGDYLANYVWEATSTLFQNVGTSSTAVEFWAPEWQYPGETQTFTLTLYVQGIIGMDGGSFGIRQVATTYVPEPVSLIIWSLLGALGVAVGWWRRRRWNA